MRPCVLYLGHGLEPIQFAPAHKAGEAVSFCFMSGKAIAAVVAAFDSCANWPTTSVLTTNPKGPRAMVFRPEAGTTLAHGFSLVFTHNYLAQKLEST